MASKPMKIRTKTKDGVTTVKALLSHPMETGLRKDKETGKVIPAHFIQELVCKLNGEQKAVFEFGISVSKNPFVQFELEGAAKGDSLELSWKDNQGQTDAQTVAIK